MSHYYVQVDDEQEIRQGDIIRRNAGGVNEEPTFGVVLTADCDIANNKAGDRFTWLQIVPAASYLELIWAPEEFKRLVEKQSRISLEGLNALIKRSGIEVSPLSSSSLQEWLREKSAEDVLQAVNPHGKPDDPKLRRSLQALRLCLGFEGSSSTLVRLRQAWALLGRDESAQQSQLRGALDTNRGFSDCLLVPELPGVTGYGFVVLLRAISNIEVKELFRSETDARINDQPLAFYRIGKFSDALRFSIAQRLAFLFSRIGMSTAFEEACDVATELLVQSVCSSPAEEK